MDDVMKLLIVYGTRPEFIKLSEIIRLDEFCFTPTKIAVKNLKKEGIDNKVYLTGNTIVEAAQRNLKSAEKSIILEKLSLNGEEYIVLTVHRAENVDNKERILGIMKVLEQIKEPIIYPIHPRILKRLKKFDLIKRVENVKNLRLIETLGYFDFLKLCADSKLIIDSGGIQEECTIYKKPVLVIRDNAERSEILEKFGWLTRYDTKRIIKGYNYIVENYIELENKLKIFGISFWRWTSKRGNHIMPGMYHMIQRFLLKLDWGRSERFNEEWMDVY